MADRQAVMRQRKKILEQAEPAVLNGKYFTQQVNDQLALQLSWWTVKRILQQAGFTWRRVKKSLKSQRDEQMFSFFKEEIAHLRAMEQQGEIELWFYDETGFSLNTNVPYAWQHKASEFTLSAQRGNVVTVAGFLRTDNSFEAYYTPGSMNTDLFMGYIEDFIKKRVSKKTILILDRASFHTAAKVKEKLQVWQKQNLFVQFLPAYCSDLNLIENLWRFIKHEWLPLKAYQSAQTLKEHLLYILQNFGSKYRISFI